MKQIVCFGDSNTYGYIPKEGTRYPWGVRWTSILNEKLGLEKYRVLEQGLCGRTTIFEDPLRDGRNGLKMLPAVLETSGPADFVVIMLGTNDLKTVYGASAEVIGKGAERLIKKTQQYAKDSKILLISPIFLGEQIWKKEFDPEFSKASVEVSKQLGEVYKRIAKKENIAFLDASSYAKPSDVDQEHLNEEGHRLLAQAIYNRIIELEKEIA
ncbi:SGNH/GDSL hydrolase family protein [[Clostridium] polysaccharolyticum]|uniref:Lysophospholipase L1 n=1 Tax=[Clostridium] polysaccharolyticum TaxID=29364 RepID=A0A1I0G0D5_9FIRM|nr:SGNH/GDSL hydrolase family protein [[Clostridium] polysaccharolyticum]SET64285.1 Lysophospholipase L1 [[Clostridium] polysaccharolyticum]